MARRLNEPGNFSFSLSLIEQKLFIPLIFFIIKREIFMEIRREIFCRTVFEFLIQLVVERNFFCSFL